MKNSRPTTQAGQKGFTLVELIMALALLGVLALTLTRTMQSTTASSKKLTQNLDQQSRIRAALNVIRTDVMKATNFRDINIFLYNEAQKERAKRYEGRVKKWIEDYNKKNKPTPALTRDSMNENIRSKMDKELGPKPESKKRREEKIVTHFKGDKEKFYFTTASGLRFREDQKSSKLMETGYFIRSCKSRRQRKKESDCLWRNISYNLDGEVTEGGEASVLLEDVEDFEVSYLSPALTDEPEWLEKWDSLATSDSRFGNKFPSALKIKLKANMRLSKDQDKKKSFQVIGAFDLPFPNNEPFKKLKKSNNSGASGL